MKITAKLWIGIIILASLTPLGLILPRHFKAGAGWGEWSVEEVHRIAGYIPKGLEGFSNFWKAPLPDYAFTGWSDKGLARSIFAYVISAIVGIAITALTVAVIGKLMTKKGE